MLTRELHCTGSSTLDERFAGFIWDGIACCDAILDVKFSDFANIRHHFGASFSLGDAPRQGRDDCNEPSVWILLEDYGVAHLSNHKTTRGYSYLKAISGSIFVARRAGTYVAKSATEIKTSATAA